MIKYACISQYFDNGKVKAFVHPVCENQVDEFKSTIDSDLYVEVFSSKEEAEQWAAAARKA